MGSIADDWKPPPIWLGENHIWDAELSLYEACDLLLYLHSHDPYQIRRYVQPRLKLPYYSYIYQGPEVPPYDESNSPDDAMSKEWEGERNEEWEEPESPDDALANEDERVADEGAPIPLSVAEQRIEANRLARIRRGMLKGLTMELLCAAVIRHVGRPQRVVAWARQRDGHPYLAAGAGTPDITAVFPGGSLALPHVWKGLSGPHRLLLEVSANRQPDENHFLTQLNGAYKHAKAEAKEHGEVTVDVLLINGCPFYDGSKVFHRRYLEFVHENALDEDSAIRIVPMYAPDFAIAMGTLFFEIEGDTEKLGPRPLFIAIRSMLRVILQPKLPSKTTWMIDMFVDFFFGRSNWFPKVEEDEDGEDSEVSDESPSDGDDDHAAVTPDDPGPDHNQGE